MMWDIYIYMKFMLSCGGKLEVWIVNTTFMTRKHDDRRLVTLDQVKDLTKGRGICALEKYIHSSQSQHVSSQGVTYSTLHHVYKMRNIFYPFLSFPFHSTRVTPTSTSTWLFLSYLPLECFGTTELSPRTQSFCRRKEACITRPSALSLG